MATTEKELKAVDMLLECVAENIKNQPGMATPEQVYKRAVELIEQHPVNRFILAIVPHLHREVK